MDNSDRPRRLVSFIVVAKSLQMLEVEKSDSHLPFVRSTFRKWQILLMAADIANPQTVSLVDMAVALRILS